MSNLKTQTIGRRMQLTCKFLVTLLVASLLVAVGGQAPALATVPNAPERVSAIEANAALWVGAATPGGFATSSMTFQATLDISATPTVAGTCTVSYMETYAGQVKRCKIAGLTNGTGYHIRAFATGPDGDSSWAWEAWGPFIPSAAAVQIFSGGNADCSYWPSEAHPCGNNNVATTVTMPGQNLQNCTSIDAIGGGGGPISITPASDGTWIQFTIPAGVYGWVNFNWSCGLGNRSAFLGNNIGSLAQYSGYTPSWSQTSGSAAGGNTVTLTTSSPTFYGITSLTLQGNAVTYTVVDLYTLRITIPAGTAGYADLVMVNSNGTGTYTNGYYYTAPNPPGTPNAPSVSAGDGKVTVTPSDSGLGGSPTSYTVTASPGGATCTVTLPDTSCDVTGLTNGVSYTFTVTATNADGTSASSSASSSASPHAPLIATTSQLQFDNNQLAEGQLASVTTTITAGSGASDPSGTTSWFYCYNAVSSPTLCSPSMGTALTGASAVTVSAGTAGDHASTSRVANFAAPAGNGYYIFRAEYSGDSIFDSSWQTASVVFEPAVTPGTPGTPTGSAGDGSVDLSWSAPSTGTAPFTYTVTSTPAGATCSITLTTATCSGLTNGTAYTFTVTATNAAGSSTSSASASITPSAQSSSGGSSGPTPPTNKPVPPTSSNVTVTPGNGSITVGLNYGGSNAYRPSSYTITVNPGGNSCVIYSDSESCEILGLKQGIEYQISVVANNSLGSSAALVLPTRYLLNSSGLLKNTSLKAIPKFAADSAKLTKAFKSSIASYLKSHPTVNAFTCTGYIAGKAFTKSQRKLAKARAISVCGYIHVLRPRALTTIIGATPSLKFNALNRKVIIRAYSPVI